MDGVYLPDHPDAQLIAVAQGAARAMRLLLDSNSGAVTLTDPQFDVAYDDAHEWGDRLIAMQATTMEGMAAKAGVMRLVMELRIPKMLGETVEDCADTHDLIALSLADDLLAGRTEA